MAGQIRGVKFAIGGALALGVALASMPAFAQSANQYPVGRPMNNGGMVSGAVSSNPQPQQYYNYAASQPKDYPIGRPLNDGGMASGAANTNPQPQNYSYSPSQPSDYRYPLGRPMNDGGMVAAQ